MQTDVQTSEMAWMALCPKGLEPLLADEISHLGGKVERETHMGVAWKGDLEVVYRVCLWSRLASRILLPLYESQVTTADDLYDSARKVDWPGVFPVSANFRIDFHGRNDQIRNTQFGAQRIKDAVVDGFRDHCGQRPSVDKDAAVRIEARLAKGKLSLFLNLSGDSLHRRGYRLQPGKAPLKENLAAALLIRAGWPEKMATGEHLIDPMCGSGTLLIEAALMAADIAPGLNRQKWGFSDWKGHDRKLWMALCDEARQRRTQGLAQLQNRFYGFDIDAEQLNAAQKNLERAGLSDKVHLERRGVDALRVQKDVMTKGGLLICNPPYGERLSELPQLAPLYQQLHQAALKVPQWPLAVFTGNVDLAKVIRRPMDKQYRFVNGQIATRLLMFGAADERSLSAPDTLIRGPVEAFANRLKKNLKQLNKWAKREQVSCYRLYDADLPEYAVAIDRYQAEQGEWLHVQEYTPPKSIDPEKAERRLLDVLGALPEVTGVAPERIVLKRRERQSGKRQYEKVASDEQALVVQEGAVKLQVNLRDYLDTGLFLDHRPTRLWLHQQLKPGQRFLNLFCYTATASVHAAQAGAHCTSVDMSRTYLNWGKDNFGLNAIDPAEHAFVQQDCMQWLAQQGSDKFDVIFMDPPTFSNSKRMEGVLDIQRDHVRLIEQAMALLNPGGVLVFSTNLRKFQLDEDALSVFNIQAQGAKSVPFDFSRRPNIHHCFHIRSAQ
ncbi:ribosomal RNA large subunit methyltransferase K/L [Bacterioplanes sanyensis]|uniref:bifunctional 23S rRNA (guanine(2069)-N(7))-methyltransferase RlmK/23S rRNA (guanine(2445)-N(2))-methyltransferase RlmL n=1 Tax=Bacterioplanes sanyensis TaxID=1249553 RepID=UPI001677323B|nr:bifunctional 23S rRNA (guanine(2069)-N(7))-methyltransferase RlmK/23S rRNA (guanine(2445)-N(2))-methyltransferase RlmL [Bacterioplanes sanyensis]GGY35575.1 ribosomal RNA large subunit methyltransferase K/L [Bacterioplanes sanyensis]